MQLQKVYRSEKPRIETYKQDSLRAFHKTERLKKIALPAVVSLLGLASITYAGISVLKVVNEVSPYTNYSPEGIIRLYFQSINQLDIDTISVIAHRSVVRMRRYIMSSMVVMEKLSSLNQDSYKPFSILEWEAAGFPDLYNQILYGVKLHSVNEIYVQNDTKEYELVYDEWSSSTDEAELTNGAHAPQMYITQTRITARVSLEYHRDFWRIRRFITQTSEDISEHR